MRPSLSVGALTLLLALPVAAQQQGTSAPQPAAPAAKKANQAGDQQKGKAQESQPPAANQNPFPEAQSEAAAHPAPQQNQSGDAAPDQPRPHAGNSPSDQNPFPEAQSEKAAHEAEQQQSSAPENGKPGASGDKDYSSSQNGLKGLDLPGSSQSRTADGAGGTVLSPELGRKDTKVGDFYLQSGDYKGAYDRFAEATKVDPANAEAVFGLAEAARHLNRRAEAVSNYQLYLSALPDGPKAKDARKALKELGAPPS